MDSDAVSIQKLILTILKKSEQDLVINEIAKRAGINRITAAKYLMVLETRKLVKHRNIGKAKLFSPTANLKDIKTLKLEGF